MNALEIKHLVKSYGDTRAVNDISFSIPKGDFFGFLGPNGAGKTTTIKCVTGVAVFQSGSIEVFGLDVVKQYREARAKIGISPQEFNIDIFATPRAILDCNAGFFGLTKDKREERVSAMEKQFDLTSFMDRPFMALSGGMKRRVVIARAMVHDPDLLILDEPTAGVDVEQRHELWRYFRELNEKGKTILLTSHYLEEVEMLCSRIAIINHGTIVAIGDKSEFVSDGRKLEERYLELTR